MRGIELYLKAPINKSRILFRAVNVNSSLIIMSCKRGAIRWIAPLCYIALYFLGGLPFSAASLSARHLRSKYL